MKILSQLHLVVCFYLFRLRKKLILKEWFTNYCRKRAGSESFKAFSRQFIKLFFIHRLKHFTIVYSSNLLTYSSKMLLFTSSISFFSLWVQKKSQWFGSKKYPGQRQIGHLFTAGQIYALVGSGPISIPNPITKFSILLSFLTKHLFETGYWWWIWSVLFLFSKCNLVC